MNFNDNLLKFHSYEPICDNFSIGYLAHYIHKNKIYPIFDIGIYCPRYSIIRHCNNENMKYNNTFFFVC